jgi:hypothetical protein
LILGATNGALVGSYLRNFYGDKYFGMSTGTWLMVSMIPIKFLVGVATLAIVRAVSKYSCIFILTRMLPPVAEKQQVNVDDIDRSLSVVQTLMSSKDAGMNGRSARLRKENVRNETDAVEAHAQSSKSRYAIELPTKTITYSLVGLFATFVCPKTFHRIDLAL